MKNKELKNKLLSKYSQNKRGLSDPLELLEMTIDCHGMSENEKSEAVELAEDVYFNYNRDNE